MTHYIDPPGFAEWEVTLPESFRRNPIWRTPAYRYGVWLGDLLKKRFSGWTAYLFTADMRLPKMIRLAASRRIPLFNGALECRLFEYRMVEGGMRKKKQPPDEPR